MATMREIHEAVQREERVKRSRANLKLEGHRQQLEEAPLFSNVRRLARKGIRVEARAVRVAGERMLAAGDAFMSFILDGGDPDMDLPYVTIRERPSVS